MPYWVCIVPYWVLLGPHSALLGPLGSRRVLIGRPLSRWARRGWVRAPLVTHYHSLTQFSTFWHPLPLVVAPLPRVLPAPELFPARRLGGAQTPRAAAAPEPASCAVTWPPDHSGAWAWVEVGGREAGPSGVLPWVLPGWAVWDVRACVDPPCVSRVSPP